MSISFRRRLAFMLVLGAVPLVAAPPGCQLLNWYREYDGGDDETALGTHLAEDWSTYVVGTTNLPGTGYDMYVRKYTLWGSLAWASTRSGFSDRPDRASAVHVDAQGDVLICGREYIADQQVQLVVAALDGSDGSAMWEYTFPAGRCMDVTTDDDGNILVAGYTRSQHPPPAAGNDQFLAKLDPAGNLIWTAADVEANAQHDSFLKVVVASDGTIFASGYVDVLDNESWVDTHAFVAAYSSAGTRLWSRTVAGYDQVMNGGDGVVLGPNDELFWVHADTIDRDELRHIERIDPSDGSNIWQITFDPALGENAEALVVDCTGGLTVIGSIETEPDHWEAWFSRYDTGGVYVEEFIEDVLEGQHRSVAAEARGVRLALGGHFYGSGGDSGPRDVFVSAINYEPDDCTPLAAASVSGSEPEVVEPEPPKPEIPEPQIPETEQPAAPPADDPASGPPPSDDSFAGPIQRPADFRPGTQQPESLEAVLPGWYVPVR